MVNASGRHQDMTITDRVLAQGRRTVADAPIPLIFNKDMKNVPESDYWVWDALNGSESYPEPGTSTGKRARNRIRRCPGPTGP
jgi:hypothetical protein